MLDSTPKTYAMGLAQYISDPSTIRARTVDYFGHGPTLEQCKAYRQKVEDDIRAARELADSRTAGEENISYSTGAARCLTCRREVEKEAAKRYRARKKPLWPKHYKPPIRQHNSTDIIAEVADAFCLTASDLRGENRAVVFVDARAVAARLMNVNGASYKRIGMELGGRDHSTICNLMASWQKRCAKRPAMLEIYNRMLTA
jgi:chromosomal replication initiation ATPase DnaA